MLIVRGVKWIIQAVRNSRNPNTTNQDQTVPPASSGPQNAHDSQLAPTVVEPQRDMKAVWILRGKLLASLILPVLTETLDYTIVATAQPHIASAFDKLELQSWIGTTYVLTSTVFLPLWGYGSDVFGRHSAIQLALLLFLVGSAMCTGATHIVVLLVGRAISGIGAAGLTSVSRVILFEDKTLDDTAFQSAMLTLMYAIGYSVGPVLGGVLTSASWRWIFAINLPICVLSSILIFLLIRKLVTGPQPPRPRPKLPTTYERDPYKDGFFAKLARMDWIGAALFIAGGILLLLALHWGGTEGWNTAKVIVGFVVGGVLMVAFAYWEYIMKWFEEGKRTPPRSLEFTDGMIPISIFKDFDVCACFWISLSSGAVMLGVFYQLAIYFSVSRGYSATKSGVQLLYFTPGIGIGVILTRSLITRLRQPQIPTVLGTAIIPVALGLLSRALGQDKPTQINWFLAMTGLGIGFALPAVGIQARFSQPPARVAIVISLIIFFQTAGGTIALAQMAAVMNNQVRSYIISQVRSGAITPQDASTLAFSSQLDSIQNIQSLDPKLLAIVQAAFRQGVRWAFLSLIPWCGISFFLSLGFSKIQDHVPTGPTTQKDASSPNEEHEMRQASDVRGAQHI